MPINGKLCTIFLIGYGTVNTKGNGESQCLLRNVAFFPKDKQLKSLSPPSSLDFKGNVGIVSVYMYNCLFYL